MTSMTRLSFFAFHPHHHDHRRRRHRRHLTFSATAATSAAGAVEDNPPPKPHFMIDYLITTCSFSPEKAISLSKRLTRIKSPHQPDSFLLFMRTHGFHETHIAKLISLNPQLLCLDVHNTLLPKFQSLHNLGFSESDLTHLIISNPNVLNLRFNQTVLPKIELWIRLLGSIELLMKYIKKNQWILSYSIEKTVLPNLALLRECGISEERISMAVRKHPRILLHKPDTLRQLIEQVEGLGVPRQSGMFLWALWTLRRVSKARFNAKLELLMSLGWSEADFILAFQKAPGFLSVSEERLREKMEFLVKEAGCEPSYVALHPLLLSYSLEKRLIPRYHAMEVLNTRGIHKRNYQLFSLMTISEKKFMEKFVLCHKDEVPGLLDGYTAMMR